MSYCRWSECDVYAYDSEEGVRFYVASNKSLDRLCSTYNEAYQYAKSLHDTHGLDVPSHAIEALKAEAIEEAARICGPDSAVTELEAENDKLRELVIDFDKCLDTAMYLAGVNGFATMPDQELFDSLRQRMQELGVVL